MFQMQYFQDDIFCDTRITDEPTMTANAWLNDANTQPKLKSLKPADMKKREIAQLHKALRNILVLFYNS